ncbi:hypothetical protein DFH11DRAFT_136223 [Phellopilus nigrolimitatus]|nr:hypothetical protein DFH11DRAFT_136223 [Phellopilus nigrolimitatus]
MPISTRPSTTTTTSSSSGHDGNESMISGSNVPMDLHTLPPYPDSPLRHTRSPEVGPNDSASVMDNNRSGIDFPSLRRAGTGGVSSLAPPVLIDNGTYVFKFSTPSKRMLRFQAHHDNIEHLREVIEGKLVADRSSRRRSPTRAQMRTRTCPSPRARARTTSRCTTRTCRTRSRARPARVSIASCSSCTAASCGWCTARRTRARRRRRRPVRRSRRAIPVPADLAAVDRRIRIRGDRRRRREPQPRVERGQRAPDVAKQRRRRGRRQPPPYPHKPAHTPCAGAGAGASTAGQWLIEDDEEDSERGSDGLSDAPSEDVELDPTFARMGRFPGTVKIVVEGTTFW